MRRHFCRRGFTLIEVIMIIIITALAIPTLLLLMGHEAEQGVDAELRVTGTNLAEALIEELRTKDWDDIEDYNDSVTVNDVTYSRVAQVCNVPSGDLNDTSSCDSDTQYKRISVTVSNAGLNFSLELVTLATNY